MPIEWIGALVGIAGTALLSSKEASKRSIRLTAFSLYLLSNACVIVTAWPSHLWGLVAMQIVYTGFSLRGIYNNWR